MNGDLIEFHSIAYSAQRMANEGISLNFAYKAVLVAKKVSELGYFIWVPIWYSLGFFYYTILSEVKSVQFRLLPTHRTSRNCAFGQSTQIYQRRNALFGARSAGL